jgi:hypothetical protein
LRHDVAITVAGPNTLDVALATSATGSIAGRIATSSGTPLQGACAAALAGGGNPHFTTPTGPDGTYRFDGLGPGQYYVGFFGCDTNDPLRPIPDPAHPGATYTPQWFSNAPLGTNPDPYGDGATPVTVAGSAVTTVDECLDACNRTITIIGVTPGDGRITVAFTATVNGQSINGQSVNGAGATASASATDVGAAATSGYTASCTSADGGASGQASGAGSPLVVSGLTNGHTYTCTVTTTDGRIVYSSAASAAVVAGATAVAFATDPPTPHAASATLPSTGSNLIVPLTVAALALLLTGISVLMAARRGSRASAARG